MVLKFLLLLMIYSVKLKKYLGENKNFINVKALGIRGLKIV